jgi:hypothetical protein
MLRAGNDGVASGRVQAKRPWITPYGLSRPLQLPNGECFGEYFGPAGVLTNTAKKFVGKPGSPSGAFVDRTP